MQSWDAHRQHLLHHQQAPSEHPHLCCQSLHCCRLEGLRVRPVCLLQGSTDPGVLVPPRIQRSVLAQQPAQSLRRRPSAGLHVPTPGPAQPRKLPLPRRRPHPLSRGCSLPRHQARARAPCRCSRCAGSHARREAPASLLSRAGTAACRSALGLGRWLPGGRARAALASKACSRGAHRPAPGHRRPGQGSTPSERENGQATRALHAPACLDEHSDSGPHLLSVDDILAYSCVNRMRRCLVPEP
mmetsp:Transcript_115431/g.337577  ORF Transcript_115431/g.337577 Transcript_115431/m.337577 type:complete len:243 (-) Transcript_115431:28-756(-)